jgi:hypothetical protein
MLNVFQAKETMRSISISNAKLNDPLTEAKRRNKSVVFVCFFFLQALPEHTCHSEETRPLATYRVPFSN